MYKQWFSVMKGEVMPFFCLFVLFLSEMNSLQSELFCNHMKIRDINNQKRSNSCVPYFQISAGERAKQTAR